jgi:hypothetical protein
MNELQTLDGHETAVQPEFPHMEPGTLRQPI